MISERASTALATVATVCWCIQLIPQIWYNWKRKDCTGLPPIMMFLWVVSGIPFAIFFCVSEGNITLQVQPHLFMFFCSISFVQSCYYPPVSLERWKIAAILGAFAATDVGTEVGFILWLRPLYRQGVHWPALIFGILASVFLAIGLIPPYVELAKRKGRVVGINFLFLFVDSLGAWLSIISVVVGNMDVMGIILYCVVAALELGIFASHFVWCCRFKWFNKERLHEGETDLELEKHDDSDDGANESAKNKTSICDRDSIVHDDCDESSIGNSVNDRLSENDKESVMFRAVHGVSVQRERQTYELCSLDSTAG